jgi:hypothetical protein
MEPDHSALARCNKCTHAMSVQGSRAVLLASSDRPKSVSAVPPIPGMTAVDRSTYAQCQKETKRARRLSAAPFHRAGVAG